MTNDRQSELLDMTVGVVANFVSHNQIRPDEIAALITSTHAALSNAGSLGADVTEEPAKPTSAQIKRSVSNAGLISFIDGKTYQTLKRHLTNRGYTPQSYREVFGLRPDYPMVGPAYAAKRSALAKASGLGQGGRKPKAAATAAPKVRAKARKPKT